MTIQLDSSLALAVFCLLALIGLGYNALIAWAGRRGFLEGYLSLAVALGVLITLAGVAVVSWQAALLTLGAFVASGSPMVFGSVLRYIQLRHREQMYERQAARMAECSEKRT